LQKKENQELRGSSGFLLSTSYSGPFFAKHKNESSLCRQWRYPRY